MNPFLTCQLHTVRNTASYLWRLSKETSVETSIFRCKDARGPVQDWWLWLTERKILISRCSAELYLAHQIIQDTCVKAWLFVAWRGFVPTTGTLLFVIMVFLCIASFLTSGDDWCRGCDVTSEIKSELPFCPLPRFLESKE